MSGLKKRRGCELPNTTTPKRHICLIRSFARARDHGLVTSVRHQKYEHDRCARASLGIVEVGTNAIPFTKSLSQSA